MMAQSRTAPVQGYCNPGNAGYPQQPQPVRPAGQGQQPTAQQMQEAVKKIVPVLANGTNDAIKKMFVTEDGEIRKIEQATNTTLTTCKVVINSPDGTSVTVRVRPIDLYKTYISPNLTKTINELPEGKRRVLNQIIDCCNATLQAQYQFSLRAIEAEIRRIENPNACRNITLQKQCEQTPLSESRILRQYALHAVINPTFAKYVNMVEQSLGVK